MTDYAALRIAKVMAGNPNIVDYDWISYDKKSPWVFVYSSTLTSKTLVSTDISDFLPIVVDNNYITKEYFIRIYRDGIEGVIYGTYQNRWVGFDQLRVLLYL